MSMNNLQKAFKDNVKRYPTKAKTTYENQRALFGLIIEHPDYIEGVLNLRKQFSLPKEGYLDMQKAFLWEQENKEDRVNIENGLRQLLSGFSYPSVFHRILSKFTYDIVVCPARTKPFLMETDDDEKWVNELQRHIEQPIISTASVRTTYDKEINKHLIDPDSTYIKITPTMTYKDLEKVFSDVKLKKVNLPFSVSKPERISKFIWQASRAGILTDKEIGQIINDKFGVKVFSYMQVAQYRKRYKDILVLFKPLGKGYKARLKELPVLFE